ncbi:MAG TPA: ABC transporter ATP-binding protein [Candidatus Saccharimonadales bacterium]|nr:ABC transporter ATP-binding protein [Candidatus Saccharimonadales bacterium]
MDQAIVIKKLSVTLGGQVQALRNVDLALPTGQTIGIIGPSGAGKTTLIRSIVGRQKITHGSIEVFGQPAGSASLRSQSSYMTQNLSVYPDLTVRQNLEYFAVMAGSRYQRGSKQVVANVLETIELATQANQLVATLSGGQKQRASLGVALLAKPPLLVLDEPTVGLDPVLRDKLWQLFHQLAEQGSTLVISSHSMDEAARCDDLVLIRDGRVIAHEAPAALLKRTATKNVEAAFLQLVGGAE